MAFRIPYRLFDDGHGGYLPSVTLRVQLGRTGDSSQRSRVIEAIIDSGATRCVFTAEIAAEMGIDLKSGVREIALGIGGEQEMWLHDVMLYLPGGAVEIHAAFQEDMPLAGLLGMQGFFEHFRITFDGAVRQCELERLFKL